LEVGMFYFLNNKFDQAIVEFEKTIAMNPKNAEAYYNLGLIYQTKNNKEMAIEMFKKALTFKPDHKLSRDHLSKLKGL
jgi:Tfp pilus assembly protein PilF